MASHTLLLILACALLAGPQYAAAEWTWPSWVPWSTGTTSTTTTTPTTSSSSSQYSSGSRKSLTPSTGSSTPVSSLPSSQTPAVPVTTTSAPTTTTTTPASTSPTAPGSTGGLSGAADYITPHNIARKSYGAGPLTRNSDLEAFAQNLVNKCVFAHSGGPYGENLYAASGAASLMTWQKAVDAWMSESSKYNPAAPNYQIDGHFTQVVWKGSTQVGCAVKACPSGQSIFACDYYPRGNMQGNYSANVGTLQG